MNTKRFFIFSILITLLGMAGGFLPVNAKANAAIKAGTATPALGSSLKRALFDLARANKVPPVDIINQISFTSTGGGGLCENATSRTPAIIRSSSSSQELMVPSYMAVCGWEKNEKLSGNVKFPDGRVQSITVKNEPSDGFYSGELRFKPGPNDPIGKYTLTITGKSKSLQVTVNYIMPRGAHIYRLDDKHLLLYGFLPSENINLYYYGGNGTLEGWQSYTTGTDGKLEIETSMKLNSGYFFVAIGKKSGEVPMLFDGYYGGAGDWVIQSTIKQDGKVICPNGILSRVKIGDRIRAAYTDGTRLRIRDKIGFENIDKYKVEEGTKMTITAGPKCTDDGVTWWQVEVSADVKGWVAEYWHGNEYLIEPAP